MTLLLDYNSEYIDAVYGSVLDAKTLSALWSVDAELIRDVARLQNTASHDEPLQIGLDLEPRDYYKTFAYPYNNYYQSERAQQLLNFSLRSRKHTRVGCRSNPGTAQVAEPSKLAARL